MSPSSVTLGLVPKNRLITFSDYYYSSWVSLRGKANYVVWTSNYAALLVISKLWRFDKKIYFSRIAERVSGQVGSAVEGAQTGECESGFLFKIYLYIWKDEQTGS